MRHRERRYGEGYDRRGPGRRRPRPYGLAYDRPFREERARGYGLFGPGARLPRRPARGFPARGVHSYDLDYGRQAGGPETDYSGRAGYPVPEPRWEPPTRGVYEPRLYERDFRERAFVERGVEDMEPFEPPEERRRPAGGRGRFDRRERFGARPRTPFRQRPMRRPPPHWSTEERPGRRR